MYESIATKRPDKAMLVDSNPLAEPEPLHCKAAEAWQAEVDREDCFGVSTSRLLQRIEKLPRKFLPPGCPKDYWWTFLGTPGNFERFSQSYGTFKQVWKHFENILSFDDMQEQHMQREPGSHPGSARHGVQSQGIHEVP